MESLCSSLCTEKPYGFPWMKNMSLNQGLSNFLVPSLYKSAQDCTKVNQDKPLFVRLNSHGEEEPQEDRSPCRMQQQDTWRNQQWWPRDCCPLNQRPSQDQKQYSDKAYGSWFENMGSLPYQHPGVHFLNNWFDSSVQNGKLCNVKEQPCMDILLPGKESYPLFGGFVQSISQQGCSGTPLSVQYVSEPFQYGISDVYENMVFLGMMLHQRETSALNSPPKSVTGNLCRNNISKPLNPDAKPWWPSYYRVPLIHKSCRVEMQTDFPVPVVATSKIVEPTTRGNFRGTSVESTEGQVISFPPSSAATVALPPPNKSKTVMCSQDNHSIVVSPSVLQKTSISPPPISEAASCIADNVSELVGPTTQESFSGTSSETGEGQLFSSPPSPVAAVALPPPSKANDAVWCGENQNVAATPSVFQKEDISHPHTSEALCSTTDVAVLIPASLQTVPHATTNSVSYVPAEKLSQCFSKAVEKSRESSSKLVNSERLKKTYAEVTKGGCIPGALQLEMHAELGSSSGIPLKCDNLSSSQIVTGLPWEHYKDSSTLCGQSGPLPTRPLKPSLEQSELCVQKNGQFHNTRQTSQYECKSEELLKKQEVYSGGMTANSQPQICSRPKYNCEKSRGRKRGFTPHPRTRTRDRCTKLGSWLLHGDVGRKLSLKREDMCKSQEKTNQKPVKHEKTVPEDKKQSCGDASETSAFSLQDECQYRSKNKVNDKESFQDRAVSLTEGGSSGKERYRYCSDSSVDSSSSDNSLLLSSSGSYSSRCHSSSVSSELSGAESEDSWVTFQDGSPSGQTVVSSPCIPSDTTVAFVLKFHEDSSDEDSDGSPVNCCSEAYQVHDSHAWWEELESVGYFSLTERCPSLQQVKLESGKDTGEEYCTAHTQGKKKVQFADSRSLVTVHPMIAWDYAYRAARSGPWVTLAADRTRFHDRIERLRNVIEPVLQAEHRHKKVQEWLVHKDAQQT